MSVWRRVHETFILVMLTPLGTLGLFALAAAFLYAAGFGSPALWWIAAAIAAPFLAIDIFVMYVRKRSGTSLRAMARTVTDAARRDREGM
jgi:hypothetical protein